VSACDHDRYTAGCASCQRAGRFKNERRRGRIAAGTWHPREPVETHQRRIAELRAAGMTVPAMAAVSGVPARTIYNISRGRGRWVHGDTAAALRRVDVPTPTVPVGYVDATGPRRRVQALAAIGHSLRYQRSRTGISSTAQFRLAAARVQYIDAGAAAEIAAMFRDLEHTRGLSKRAVTWAKRYGWAPPAAWDDIDDPDEQPDLGGDLVDEVAVQRVIDGKAAFHDLNEPEKALAVNRLRDAGASRNTTAVRLRIGTFTVDKFTNPGQLAA
jgi:hypothetical protein